MLEWESFLLVGVVSLVAAIVVVTVASFGMKLYENSMQARAIEESSGRLALTTAKVLFGICGLVVLFGVYLIVPAFH